jgi:hypothetical protein
MARLAGTWRLVATRQRMTDGTTRPDPDLGSKPSGYLMFDATAGQMCAVINNGDRANWASAAHPTDAEAQAIWAQTVSYCGSWSVDSTGGELVYQLGANMSPNLIGAERRRRFALDGDRLILYPTPLPAGVSEWTVEWRKTVAQQPAPRFLYIYRDSIKRGVDSAYRVIENDGAQVCADHHCPNPYLGLESLTGPHEAWWLNAFATPADTARVAKAYATDRELSTALAGIAQRKAALIGKPVQGFAVYRPDLSRGPAWSVGGARLMVVTITRDHQPADGSVWMTADSTVYILRAVRTQREAEELARNTQALVLAIRPNWSMPAAAWVSADPAFWRAAPAARPRR